MRRREEYRRFRAPGGGHGRRFGNRLAGTREQVGEETRFVGLAAIRRCSYSVAVRWRRSARPRRALGLAEAKGNKAPAVAATDGKPPEGVSAALQYNRVCLWSLAWSLGLDRSFWFFFSSSPPPVVSGRPPVGLDAQRTRCHSIPTHTQPMRAFIHKGPS